MDPHCKGLRLGQRHGEKRCVWAVGTSLVVLRLDVIRGFLQRPHYWFWLAVGFLDMRNNNYFV